MEIVFNDYSVQVLAALGQYTEQFLEEVGGEISSQAAKNTRRRTGQTAGGWTHIVTVNDDEQLVTICNPLQNAIWEEFGTGEYALKGNGRKGGWVYRDPVTGKFYKTHGKTPTRALHYAFKANEGKVENRARYYLSKLSE